MSVGIKNTCHGGEPGVLQHLGLWKLDVSLVLIEPCRYLNLIWIRHIYSFQIGYHSQDHCRNQFGKSIYNMCLIFHSSPIVSHDIRRIHKHFKIIFSIYSLYNSLLANTFRTDVLLKILWSQFVTWSAGLSMNRDLVQRQARWEDLKLSTLRSCSTCF